MSDWQEALSDDGSGEVWNREGTIQGIYKQKKENVGPNNSNMYLIKNDKGIEVGVWGSAVLDSRMGQIPVGNEIRITSLGKTKSEKTGREYFDYKVEFRAAPFTEAGKKPAPEPEPTANDEEDINLADIPF